MAYTDILNNTCNNSVSGVKELYLATRYDDGTALNYPLPVTYSDLNTIQLNMDISNKTITMMGNVIEYKDVVPITVNFNQELLEERQGYLYSKTLTFTIPKINVQTNNSIREFLFDQDGEFAISKALVLIKDNNNVNWIAGYDIPFEIDEFDLQTDYRNGNNQYSLTYTNRSYYPAIKYILI